MYEYRKMILDVDGRKVALTCMHVGIDLLHINEILMAKSFTTQMKVWKEKFANKVIVAGSISIINSLIHK